MLYFSSKIYTHCFNQFMKESTYGNSFTKKKVLSSCNFPKLSKVYTLQLRTSQEKTLIVFYSLVSLKIIFQKHPLVLTCFFQSIYQKQDNKFKQAYLSAELNNISIEMKAAVYQKFGNAQVVTIKNVPKPVEKPNQILVKIKATTVNSGDVKLRSKNVAWFYWLPLGIFAGFRKPKFPILGTAFSGVVQKIGSDVTLFKVGDQVFGSLGTELGTHAEYIAVPQNYPVLKKPKKLTFQEAASIPFGAQTALFFLKKANIQAGQKVLIYGASGSCGSAAVQIAKAFGTQVYGVSTNEEMIEELGGKAINYKRDDFRTYGPYDIIFESVGYSNFTDDINSLTDRGTLILISVNQLSWYFRTLWKNIIGHKRVIPGIVHQTKQNLQQIVDLWEKGQFKPLIDRVYKLEDIQQAHEYVGGGHKKSNVVITIE